MAEKMITQLVAHVDSELAEEFRAMLEQRGQSQKRVFEALLKIWRILPIGLQAKLLDNTTTDFYQVLVEGLVDVELAKELERLGPDKAEFLALVRQAKQKISRKKKGS